MGKYGEDYSLECRRRKEPLVTDEELADPESCTSLIELMGEEAYEDMVIERIRQVLG